MKQKFVSYFKKSSPLRFALLSIFVALIVLMCLVGYSNSMTQRLIDSSFGTLGEVTQQQAFNFSSHIDSDVNDLMSIAYFTTQVALTPAAEQELLDKMVLYSNFDFISMYTLDGMGFDENGNMINLNNYIDLSRARLGNTIVGNPIAFSGSSERILPIVSPIFDENAFVSGYLLGIYSLSELESLILPSFESSSYFYIVNSTGEIILSTQNEYNLLDRTLTGNLLNFMETSTQIESYDNISIVYEKIAVGESGYFSWSANGNMRYTSYMPIGVNDWYLFSFVPEDNLLSTNNEIMHSTLLFAFLSFFVFLVLVSAIMIMRTRETKRQRLHAVELENIAYYDELTGLPNYVLFKKRMKELQENHPNASFALLKFDIEQFKMVNEVLGADTGDAVLRAISTVSQDLVEKHNHMLVVARVGSDDFLVFGESSFIENGEIRFSALEDRVHELCQLTQRYRMHFRYGRYELSSDELDQAKMLENVNLAHSLAKKTRQWIVNYDDALKNTLIHENEMENHMHQALDDGEFLVYLQPKFNLKLRVIQGAEALVRWQNKNGQLNSPGEFIPLFERNGFITTLDYYMFERCCQLLSEWRRQGLAIVPISVNFSRLHLQNPNFTKEVYEITQKYDLPTSLLELELTESIAIDNEELLQDVMWELRRYGFLLSMDDFGSGFSSLGLLKSLPVDVLKIDRSFFTTDAEDVRAKAVVESVMLMAQRLNITTVAEGVELKEQADYLESISCTMSQGYYFARPMPQADFEALLRENKDNPLATKEALAAQHRKILPDTRH